MELCRPPASLVFRCSLVMRGSAVSGSGRRQWFFFWGRWYRDGKRRHHGPQSSSYVSLNVVSSNGPKFMYLCYVLYVSYDESNLCSGGFAVCDCSHVLVRCGLGHGCLLLRVTTKQETYT